MGKPATTKEYPPEFEPGASTEQVRQNTPGPRPGPSEGVFPPDRAYTRPPTTDEQIQQMANRITEQDARIAAQDARIAQQDAKIAALEGGSDAIGKITGAAGTIVGGIGEGADLGRMAHRWQKTLRAYAGDGKYPEDGGGF